MAEVILNIGCLIGAFGIQIAATYIGVRMALKWYADYRKG